MTPHKQRFKHEPDKGIFGDCDRTAMACLLDMSPDEVPHWGVHMGNHALFDKVKREWLATQGLFENHIAFECTRDELNENMRSLFRDVYVLLTGTSKNGCHHVVIARNGDIVHDPALDDSGIVSPCNDGYWWLSVLMPLCLKPEN